MGEIAPILTTLVSQALSLIYPGETELLQVFQYKLLEATIGPLLVGRWERGEDLLIHGAAENTVEL